MTVRVLLILTLLAGCAPAVETPEVTLAAALRPFDDCEALSDDLRERALEAVGPYGLGGGAVAMTARGAEESGAAVADAPQAAAADAAGQGAAGQAEAGVSGTNVQEAGVDEGDLAKTDGDWLYTVTDSALRVVDVRDGAPSMAATLRFDDGLARELLLAGDRLLVIGDAPPPDMSAPDARSLVPWVQRTRLWLVDVATPSQPEVLSTMTVDGGTLATRLTGDLARVVVHSGLAPRDLVTPQGATAGDEQRALAVNRQRIRQATVTDWLPQVAVDDGPRRPLVACDDVRAPERYGDMGMVTVLTLDTTAGALSPDRTAGVLGAADTVYATTDHLYVTTSPWLVGMPVPIDPMPMPVEPVPLPRPLPQDGAAGGGASGTTGSATSGAVAPAPDTPQAAPAAPAPADVAPAAPPADTPDGATAPGAAVEPAADGDVAVAEPAPPAATLPPPSPAPQPPPTEVPPLAPSEPVATLPPPSPAPAPSDRVGPPGDPQEPRTEIHRFDMDGPRVEYAASGSVPGQLLNQWALSEHDGDLRVATTEQGGMDPQGSHSAVRVLRERDGELREVGHVGDLGRGERIYAVRYAGDVGFVVTFRQIDPLYTIDLSDPRAPRVLGELKIPGYSAYLHPVGDDHLLGVGQDADVDGRVRGAQVSLFDIGDLRAPRKVDGVDLGAGTTSPVEFDHHAFLWWADTGTAVVPVESWSDQRIGAAVLAVDPDDGVSRRGFVEHAPHDGVPPPVQRAFVVGDRLLTVSPFDVQASDLDSLRPLGAATFAG